MILQLPCRTDALFYSFKCLLEGRSYGLTFRWNARGGFWTMTISNAGGTPIVAGRRVVTYYPLLWRFPFEELPPGEFFALDPTSNREPGVSDLGGSVQLYYVESTDLPARRGAAPQ